MTRVKNDKGETDKLLGGVQQLIRSQVYIPAIGREEMDRFLSNEAMKRSYVYLILPILFADGMGLKLTKSKKLDFVAAGYLHFVSVLKVDDVFDNPQKKMNKGNLALLMSLQGAAYQMLGRHFKSGHPFWTTWAARHELYFRQVTQDQFNWGHDLISRRNYREVAEQKNSLGLIALDCITHSVTGGNKEENKEKQDVLLAIYNHFAMASQILDDIKDINEDFTTRQMNYVLIRFPREALKTREAFEKAYKEFYTSGDFTKSYSQVFRHLNKARQLARSIGAKGWEDFITGFHNKAASEFYDVKGFVRCLNTRNQLIQQPAISANPVFPDIHTENNRYNKQIKGLIKYILLQKNKGYGELQHVMFMNKNIGLSSPGEIHINDTFQRALLADIYCDCIPLNPGFFNPLVKEETAYLISREQKDEIGGWSYYPGIPEVAADADDLGQILQVFIRGGMNGQTSRYFDGPIDLLLKDRTHPDGGMETWLVPRNSKEQKFLRQEEYNQLWGAGPDSEVMANMLYGLLLYQPDKFESVIQSGLGYLLRRMDAQGYWESKWYYGPYYGTYTCARLFDGLKRKGIRIKSKELRSQILFSRNQLLDTQTAAGGWGMTRGSQDYLNSSLALLALNYMNEFMGPSRKVVESMRRGMAYLAGDADLAQFAPFNTPFIKPRMNDPYSSKTMTTAYMLKSFLTLQSIY